MLACGSLVEGLRSLTRCWADARGAERRGGVVPTRKSEIAQKRQFWNALLSLTPPARAMDLSVSIYTLGGHEPAVTEPIGARWPRHADRRAERALREREEDCNM